MIDILLFLKFLNGSLIMANLLIYGMMFDSFFIFLCIEILVFLKLLGLRFVIPKMILVVTHPKFFNKYSKY